MAKRKHEAASRPGDASARVGMGLWELWKRQAASPEYHESAMEVFKSAGKLTRQGYLEMMLQMGAMYPGRGWHEAMDELEAFYFKQGLPLKEYPRSKELFPKGVGDGAEKA